MDKRRTITWQRSEVFKMIINSLENADNSSVLEIINEEMKWKIKCINCVPVPLQHWKTLFAKILTDMMQVDAAKMWRGYVDFNN